MHLNEPRETQQGSSPAHGHGNGGTRGLGRRYFHPPRGAGLPSESEWGRKCKCRSETACTRETRGWKECKTDGNRLPVNKRRIIKVCSDQWGQKEEDRISTVVIKKRKLKKKKPESKPGSEFQ